MYLKNTETDAQWRPPRRQQGTRKRLLHTSDWVLHMRYLKSRSGSPKVRYQTGLGCQFVRHQKYRFACQYSGNQKGQDYQCIKGVGRRDSLPCYYACSHEVLSTSCEGATPINTTQAQRGAGTARHTKTGPTHRHRPEGGGRPHTPTQA